MLSLSLMVNAPNVSPERDMLPHISTLSRPAEHFMGNWNGQSFPEAVSKVSFLIADKPACRPAGAQKTQSRKQSVVNFSLWPPWLRGKHF